MDFMEMQKTYLEENGISETEVKEVQKTLRVLRFDWDARRENVVSKIDGKITFVHPLYSGETVNVGDVWFCSVERRSTVYNAMPLLKVTSSLLMGMSDDIRDGIANGLYESHKKEYEKIFVERYRKDVYSSAVAETNKKNEAIIDSLKQRISELEDQVEKSRFVINTKNSSEEDEIELSSESGPSAAAQVQYVQPQYAVPEPVQGEQHHPYYSQCVCPAPGMPEVRMTEPVFSGPQTVRYTVTRVSSETIYSESFVDGKYFVHINPSKKFIVIKKHDYGSATCADHKIRLDGLNDYVPFNDKRISLMAEYSKRYDGMMVRF